MNPGLRISKESCRRRAAEVVQWAAGGLRDIGLHTRVRSFRIRLSTILIRDSFGRFGDGSTIHPGCIIEGQESIRVGNGVHIRSRCWIQAYDDGEIHIGDGTLIGHNCKITARRKVTIGKNVLLADNVYVTDFDRDYRDVDTPVRFQKHRDGTMVIIEDDAWLGQNVVVRPGVRIGKHSVIGSSSVVVRSVPDFSVAVGMPARVVRRYDPESREWERTGSVEWTPDL